MSRSVSETVTVTMRLDDEDDVFEVSVDAQVTFTTYNSQELYGEWGGSDRTLAEVESWDLSEDQELSDAEYQIYNKLSRDDVQDAVDAAK